MRKLLLVMLVPVLVLGVTGCGKETVKNDGTPVISAMQGFWVGKASTPVQGNEFVLSASQATVFKDTYTDQELGTVAFWINATGKISEEKEIVSGQTYSGTIEFYGYGDTKQQKIATITVIFTPGDKTATTPATIEVTKIEKEVHYENMIIPPVGLYEQN